MTVLVKICGLRDAKTVASAIEAGADAIGFVFAESVRKVSIAEANSAALNIPAHVKRVAVMKQPTRDEWREVLDGFAPDILQTDSGDFASLHVPQSIGRWPVIREGDTVTEWPAEFVYEGRQSGVGQTVDWKEAAQIAAQGRMILAGGLDAANVAAAVAETRPWGVDVSSGVESRPGKKDVDRIMEFIGAVRAAEKQQ